MNDIRDYKRRLKRHEKQMKRKERWSAVDRQLGRFKAYTIGFLVVAVIMGGAYSYEQFARKWIYDFMQWDCVDCDLRDGFDQALNKPWTDDLLGQNQDSSRCEFGNPDVDYADVSEFVDRSTAAVDEIYQFLQAHASAPKSKSEIRSMTSQSNSKFNALVEKYNFRIASHCFHGSNGSARMKLMVQLKNQHRSLLDELDAL